MLGQKGIRERLRERVDRNHRQDQPGQRRVGYRIFGKESDIEIDIFDTRIDLAQKIDDRRIARDIFKFRGDRQVRITPVVDIRRNAANAPLFDRIEFEREKSLCSVERAELSGLLRTHVLEGLAEARLDEDAIFEKRRSDRIGFSAPDHLIRNEGVPAI